MDAIKITPGQNARTELLGSADATQELAKRARNIIHDFDGINPRNPADRREWYRRGLQVALDMRQVSLWIIHAGMVLGRKDNGPTPKRLVKVGNELARLADQFQTVLKRWPKRPTQARRYYRANYAILIRRLIKWSRAFNAMSRTMKR